jgi:hypothetical protein
MLKLNLMEHKVLKHFLIMQLYFFRFVENVLKL